MNGDENWRMAMVAGEDPQASTCSARELSTQAPLAVGDLEPGRGSGLDQAGGQAHLGKGS